MLAPAELYTSEAEAEGWSEQIHGTEGQVTPILQGC